MNSFDIREKFINFFKQKNHTIVPSSSLIPDDPSVLLTTAGMQQFKPYYSKLNPETTIHPSINKPIGKNAASIQKCFRTSDIEEVGDDRHLTFFEMMGNFSFGGYYKEQAIKYAYEFLVNEMKLDIDYVTVFDPSKVPEDDWRKNVPFDNESKKYWLSLGLPEDKIKYEGIDVFWGPTGNEGPCGPTTEIYVKNANGNSIEIWNLVFNEFYRYPNYKLEPLKVFGIDTGMGFERLVMVVENKKNIFETDVFEPLIVLFNTKIPENIKRIFVDHIRSICFLISDGIEPSNKEAGYILRRLLRRLIVYEFISNDWINDIKMNYGSLINFMNLLVSKVINFYKNIYILDQEKIKIVIEQEYIKFKQAINQSLEIVNKLEQIDSKTAFKLYESYGLSLEILQSLVPNKIKNLNKNEFDDEFKKHQKISRAGVEKKFGGHGLVLDTGELKASTNEEIQKVIRLHTATHLLHQALRMVLGPTVQQMGSDINAERTRFDFSFNRKLTDDEIKKVEQIVNDAINQDLIVSFVKMPRAEAEKTGALHFFKEKYPDVVTVYYIHNKNDNDIKNAFSKEFCGGPHVSHLKEIGSFKIIKQESIGANTKRIKAIVQ
ncbi:MAG: alanine--tRNA ligase-related protein [Minisyncoccia bacterium]